MLCMKAIIPHFNSIPKNEVQIIVSLTSVLLSFFVTNNGVYVELLDRNPIVLDLATMLSVLTMGLIASFARWRPSLLHPRIWNNATACAIVGYAACCLTGKLFHSPLALALGSLLESFAESWLFLLAFSMLSLLDEKRLPSLLTATLLCAYASAWALAYLDAFWLPFLNIVLFGIGFSTATPVANELISETSNSEPVADQAAINPLSFLSAGHLFFVIVLAFNIAQGLAFSLAPLHTIPAPYAIATLLLAALLGICTLSDRQLRSDSLFTTSAIFALTGMMASPAALSSGGVSLMLAHGTLNAGISCFNLLMMLVFARAAAQNRTATVFFVSYSIMLSWLGIEAGAIVGKAFGNTFANDQVFIYWSYLLLSIVFAACCMLVAQNFSFSSAISGIRPIEKPLPCKPDTTPSLDDKCIAAAKQFKLTPRETEVLALLARGRTLRVISSQLVISPNTVRFHAKNIYAKLNVHSQQELIDVVEGTDRPV